jgi:hypothetical protein
MFKSVHFYVFSIDKRLVEQMDGCWMRIRKLVRIWLHRRWFRWLPAAEATPGRRTEAMDSGGWSIWAKRWIRARLGWNGSWVNKSQGSQRWSTSYRVKLGQLQKPTWEKRSWRKSESRNVFKSQNESHLLKRVREREPGRERYNRVLVTFDLW